MAKAPTKFSDLTRYAREGFDEVDSPFMAPGSVAAAAYAVGRYLRLSSKGWPGTITSPMRGLGYGSHFYVDGVLTYVTVQHGDDVPMVFVRP